MEITLQKQMVSLCETVSRKTSETIAESDSIVPDTKPDIGHILQIDGRAKILGQEVQGDKIRVNGMAEYTVLYTPEGDETRAVEHMEIRIPFKDVCTAEGKEEGTTVSASAEILRTEYMLLNSRKLSVKGTVGVHMEVIRQREMALCTGAEGETPLAMRHKTVDVDFPAAVGQFTISAADTLKIPGEKPPMAEILKTEAYIGEEDVKLITGKIILKGTLRLRTLYESTLPARPLEVVEHEIPFTEILDLPGTEENMDYCLDYDIADIYTEMDEEDEEARDFGAEITMEIRAKTMKKEKFDMLDDCFCPGYKTEVVYDTVQTEAVMDAVEEQLSAKKTCVLPPEYPPIREVCALSAKPIVTSVSLSDGEITVEGYADASLLYMAETEEIMSYRDRVPFAFSAKTAAPQNAEIACRVRFMGASYSLSDAGTVEIRVNMAFDLRLSAKKQVETVSEIRVSETETEDRPSVVIAFIAPGETLWSLAKKYGVPMEKIAAANGLSEDAEISEGMRLMVPKG